MSSPTDFTQTNSLTNSRRNSDKPYHHVSIDVDKYDDGHQRSGSFKQDLLLEDCGDRSNDESKNKTGKTNSVAFLGFNLHSYSTASQFCILSFGIFFFYLLYGIAMEQIFRLPGM